MNNDEPLLRGTSSSLPKNGLILPFASWHGQAPVLLVGDTTEEPSG